MWGMMVTGRGRGPGRVQLSPRYVQIPTDTQFLVTKVIKEPVGVVASKVGVDASEGPCFIADRHCRNAWVSGLVSGFS